MEYLGVLKSGHSSIEQEKPPDESETMTEEVKSENPFNISVETPLDTRKLKSFGTQNEVFQPASHGRFQISLNTVFLLWIVIVPVYPFAQTSSDVKQMKSTHPVFCSSFIVSRTTNQILVMVSWYCLLSMFYTTNDCWAKTTSSMNVTYLQLSANHSVIFDHCRLTMFCFWKPCSIGVPS